MEKFHLINDDVMRRGYLLNYEQRPDANGNPDWIAIVTNMQNRKLRTHLPAKTIYQAAEMIHERMQAENWLD